MKFSANEVFDMAYSTDIPNDIKYELLGLFEKPVEENINEEVSTKLTPYIDLLNILTESSISEELFEEVITDIFSNLDEAFINEVSDEFVRQKAQGVLRQREKLAKQAKDNIIGLNSLAKANRAQERVNKAKDYIKNIPSKKDIKDPIGLSPFSKLKDSAKKVKKWYDDNNSNQPVSVNALRKEIGKKGIENEREGKPNFVNSEPSVSNSTKQTNSAGSSSTVNKPVSKPSIETSEPVDNKPVDNKPVDNKPVDNKPVDNKPTSSTDNKPTDNKPTSSTDNKPTDNKPTDNKPKRTRGKKSKEVQSTESSLKVEPSKDKIDLQAIEQGSRNSKKITKVTNSDSKEPVPATEPPKTEKEETATAGAHKPTASEIKKKKVKEEGSTQPVSNSNKPKREAKDKNKLFDIKYKNDLRSKVKKLENDLKIKNSEIENAQGKPSYAARIPEMRRNVELLKKELESAKGELSRYETNEAISDLACLLLNTNISESSFVSIMELLAPSKKNVERVKSRLDTAFNKAVDELGNEVGKHNVKQQTVKNLEKLGRRKERFEQIYRKRFENVQL